MNRNIVCLVLGLIAIANLAFGHCHAQDQRRASGSERGVAPNSAPEVVRLAFLGDLMLGGDVSQKLRDEPPERIWGDTLPILRQMDAVIANLESPITASDQRSRRDWKFFHFKADPNAVRILTAGNVRIVNLANNHILDYGDRGLLDTLQALDRAGIGHTGAGPSRAESGSRPDIRHSRPEGRPDFGHRPHAELRGNAG
jgi:poly-gamma-glutamate synthesis protein (capsule biosynthesis protein)